MEALILNNGSEGDVKLLVDIAQKLGMDLKIAEADDLILMEANLLNRSVKPNSISFEEIADICASVRKSRHEKGKEDHS